MTAEEYNSGIKSLKETFEVEKKALIKKFCDANNPHKKGEVIKDDIGSIVIESIGYYVQFLEALPCCRYYGLELKKDGTPRKDGSRRWAYQHRVITNK